MWSQHESTSPNIDCCAGSKWGVDEQKQGFNYVAKVEVQAATIWILASRLNRNQTRRHGTQLPRNKWSQNC